MKKTSTVRVNGNMLFKGHQLTIGLDLGDRWSGQPISSIGGARCHPSFQAEQLWNVCFVVHPRYSYQNQSYCPADSALESN
jgi:hypothetical protein